MKIRIASLLANRRPSAAAGSARASEGSGAPSSARVRCTLAVLALALAVFALTAAPALAAPVAAKTPEVSNVSYTSAHVAGKITSPGEGFFGITTWAFQYSTDEVDWKTGFSGLTFNEAYFDRAVQGEIEHLKGGTKYYVRLQIINNGIEAISPGPNPSFTTLTVDPPSIIATDNASEVAYTTATLSGEISRPANPHPAFDVDCQFQYVTDAQFQATAYQNPSTASCEPENPVHVAGASKVEAKLTGLNNNTTYHLRLFVSNASPTTDTKEAASTFTTLTVGPPSVIATDDASTVFSRSARATGKVKRPANVDPAFDVTVCQFEYVTQAQFGATGFAGAGVVPCEQPMPFTVPDGETDVSATLTGLEPVTTYHLRLTAENAGPTPARKEATNTFTTTAKVASPTVLAIDNAGGVDQDSAKVSGEVERPAGEDPALDVNCRFEYVTHAQFGATGFAGAAQAPCAENPITSPEPGHPAVSADVKADLTGLTPQTTYHLRLTAENGGGTDAKDAGSTFTTTPNFPASAVVGPITEVSYGGARLSGEADAEGAFGLTTYEVSTDGIIWTRVAIGDITFSGKLVPVPPVVVTGLEGATKYFVRIRILACQAGCGGSADVAVSLPPHPSFETLPVQSPTVLKTNDASEVGFETVTLSGEIERPANPDPAFDTNCRFEYVTDAQFDANGFQGPERVPCGIASLAAPGEKRAVEVKLAELKAGTEYHVRLIATNAGPDVSLEAAHTFTTTVIPATVTASAGASDREGGYVLEGVITPHNSTISDCKFVYGPNSGASSGDYAFVIPCSPLPNGRNEIQGWTSHPNDSFRLAFRGQTTSILTFPSAAQVEAALRALPAIGPTGIASVTRVRNPNLGFFLFDYTVHFDGLLAATNLPPLEVRTIVPTADGNESVFAAYEFAAGSGNLPIVVQGHVTGLTPDATYHSRLVVTNAFGTVVTPDQIFIPTLAVKPPACPNEQIRKENSSLALPECRAYEVVTPPGKEGYAPRFGRASGDAVNYISKTGNLAKSGQNAVFSNGYVSVRKATGWETIPNLNGPSGTLRDAPSLVAGATAFLEGYGTFFYSEDLLTSVWRVHRLDDVPGDNYYLRDQDGLFTLIGPNDGNTGIGFPELTAASSDLSHLVRWSESWGGIAGGLWGSGVYETIGTGNVDPPRRVDVDNSGTPISTCTSAVNLTGTGRSVSRDGRVIVVSVVGGCGGSNPPAEEIWARVGGTFSVNVAASQCTRVTPACNAPTAPQYVATTPDGSRVFFTTTQQLVNADTDATNDIYACDIPAGSPAPVGKANPCAALTKVSVAETGAAEVVNVLETSDDGSTVMFVAKGVLADNEDALGGEAVAGDSNLYVWRTDAAHPAGQTAFVGRLLLDGDLLCCPFTQPQATPDGRHLVFTTANKLVETDTDDARDVYRYGVEAGELNRVSTNLIGVGGNADGFTASVPADDAISDDGTKIIFDTSEGLSPADGNAAQDVYLWTPGGVSLISTGSVGAGGVAKAIGPSGQNLFFLGGGALTPADGDDLTDIYNARIGGGFSFAPPPPCDGEACQPSSSGSPPAPDPVTAPPPADPGNVVIKKCPKGKILKGTKCVKKKKSKKHHKKPHKNAGHNRGGSK